MTEPSVLILSRWDSKENRPVVFPSRRNDNGQHVALVTQSEIDAELAKYEGLNFAATGRWLTYDLDVVPFETTQDFMDAKAQELVDLHSHPEKEFKVYGFD